MGRNRMVYVRDSELELWEWGVREAARRRMPMAAVVMTGLELFRAVVEGTPAPEIPPRRARPIDDESRE